MALQAVKLRSTPVRSVLKRRKQLEQDLEHITQEMYRRNKELAETNRTLSLLRAIDNLVLKSHESIAVLCGQMAEAIINTTEYPLVAFLGPPKSPSGRLELHAWKTHSSLSVDRNLLTPLRPNTRHGWFKSRETARFLSVLHLDNEKAARYLGCEQAVIDKLKTELGLKSVYVAKLLARDQMVGIMMIGSLSPVNDFKAAEADLLDRLGETLGIALDNRLLFDENQGRIHIDGVPPAAHAIDDRQGLSEHDFGGGRRPGK
jgi:GAF domain-containing protein